MPIRRAITVTNHSPALTPVPQPSTIPFVPAPSIHSLMIFLLADAEGPVAIILWSFVLIALLLAGFVAVSKVKAWSKREEDPDSAAGFTLGDLRRMHRDGNLSDEEFEKARVQMIAATQRAAERAAQAAVPAQHKGGGFPVVTDVDAIRARRGGTAGALTGGNVSGSNGPRVRAQALLMRPADPPLPSQPPPDPARQSGEEGKPEANGDHGMPQ